MTEQVSKSITLQSAHIYLDVIQAGSRLPAEGEVRFPVNPQRDRFFHFSIGQMTGYVNDDFEEVAQISLSDLPRHVGEQVDIVVRLEVHPGSDLYVEVGYTTPDTYDLLRESQYFGPYKVS